MAEVPAPLGLGGIERGVQPDRHERILEGRPAAGMGMDVSGGHPAQPEPVGQPTQTAVAGSIVAQERPLQLDPQVLWSERVSQAPERALIMHPSPSASAQADEARSMLEHHLERDARRSRWPGLLPRVRMGPREDPAQPTPASGIPHQQRQVAAIVEIDLGPVERSQAQRPGGDGELHRAGDRVVVGEGQRRIAMADSGGGDLIRQRGAVQERERRVAVELDIRHERMFAFAPDGGQTLTGGLD